MPWDKRGVRLQVNYENLAWGRCAGLLLATLGLWGCQAPRLEREPAPVEKAVERSSPDWLRSPLSWEKLGAIESWLEQDAAAHDRGLALEARLQLADGRIELTRRSVKSGAELDAVAHTRVETSRRELLAIEQDPYATPGQRTRAKLGQESAARFKAPAPVESGPTILARSAWRAKPGRKQDMTPMRGAWTRITVHHSAETADAPPGASLGESIATLQRIQKVHMDPADPNHGWGDLGYHFMIDDAGRIFEGRELTWQGAHARGSNNFQNLGVCLLGDLSRHGPSTAAQDALGELLDSLCERYKIPASRVFAHKELIATECPGPDVTRWVARYRRGTAVQP